MKKDKINSLELTTKEKYAREKKLIYLEHVMYHAGIAGYASSFVMCVTYSSPVWLSIWVERCQSFYPRKASGGNKRVQGTWVWQRMEIISLHVAVL